MLNYPFQRANRREKILKIQICAAEAFFFLSFLINHLMTRRIYLLTMYLVVLQPKMPLWY